MAFAPIALTIPQYDKLTLANWWLKAYDQGTTTPLNMATDATGGTLLVKAELDSEGFPITAGSARFIPFIDGDYDLWCFPTAAEADANDTTNAIQFADNLNADPTSAISLIAGSYTVADKAAAVLLTPVSGKSLVVESDDGGLFVAKTGAAPGTYSDDGAAFCGTVFIPTGGDGSIAWLREDKGAINVKWFGAFGDGDDYTTLVLVAISAMSTQDALYFPAGIYYVNSTMDFTGITKVTIFGDGWGSSIIKRTNATGDTLLLSRTDNVVNLIQGATIRDIQFFAEVDLTSDAVIHIMHGQRIIVDHVYIRNCHIGIHTEGIRDSRFTSLEITSNGYHTTTRTTSCHVLIDEPTDPTRPNTEVQFSNFNFTTAQGIPDLQHSIWIRGETDGVWFSDGHFFGGSKSGLICDGDGLDTFQGIRFSNVYCDQFTDINMIFTGTAVGNYRNFQFDGCRIFGGTSHNIVIGVTANIEALNFSGCEIGTNQGNGVQVGNGEVSFSGCDFRQINRSTSANGYALQTTLTSPTSTTVLSVNNCEFECSRLTYGVQCIKTDIEYNFNSNTFREQDGSMDKEIFFNANTLIGTCFGNITGRSRDATVIAATTITETNIASDAIDLVGATASIDTIYPVWHKRKITLKADTAAQNLVSGGNIQNKTGAALVVILALDKGLYEYSEDTARWHEL